MKKATVTETRFWEESVLPDAGGLGLLIIMGGPMSVNDEAVHPWLAAEKAFIRDAVARGIPTLGVCLGSQLIASAHGAQVRRNPLAEHGWFDVVRVDAPGECFAFPAHFVPFHSHGETFDLPEGAVRLAKSAACENQAFQLGERAMGIQFHLESDEASARAIVDECGEAYERGPYVTDAGKLRAVRGDYAASERLMHRLLDYLIR
jgi:GMP synthase-like glutamine amidotransferase